MDQRITPDHNQIRPEIVTTYEQLLHAYAIRSMRCKDCLHLARKDPARR
jgi:hypothetical protein